MASNAPGLVAMQEFMRDFAQTRHTPFGTAVPKFATPVFAFGFVVPAVYGTQQLVLTYQVKANWTSLICGVVLQFAGTGPAPNPGDVSFTVDIDRPLGLTAGYNEKDYAAVPFVLGNFSLGWPWPCEFKHNNGETLRVKVTPVVNMGLGAGNFIQCALIGWEWPSQGWE